MYSPGIERALHVAVAAHDERVRSGIVSVDRSVHPLHVALMLARWGQDEDVIVAGLMRGVAVTCGGWEPARLAAEFGPHVAALVGELEGTPTERLSPQAAVVRATAELHHLQTLLARLREADDPDGVWDELEGGREGELERASARVEALGQRVEPKVARSLSAALRALREHGTRAGISRAC